MTVDQQHEASQASTERTLDGIGSPVEDDGTPPAIDWNRSPWDPSHDKHQQRERPAAVGFEHQPYWFPRRKSSVPSKRRPSLQLARKSTVTRQWWMFTLRDWDDDDEQDWWFASTAIPLLAATLGPMANVLSIAALVVYWRMCLITPVSPFEAAECPWNGTASAIMPPLEGQPYEDPSWCFWLNVTSLILGFVGNFFLLCNFTNRIRYIIALPVTILLWFMATGILIGIIIGMNKFVPPTSPQQTYTQGYWYAVEAAALYCVCSMLLMVNMVGYFLGHYPQHFSLTDSQRTLILQTMMFFVWLAGGAAVFSTIEQKYGNGTFNWNYVNSLYFCDVTILTIGFGDQYTSSDVGRGLIFPFSVGGIIMLGLMVSSITKFAKELSSEKFIQQHVEKSRVRTIGRTVTNSTEMNDRSTLPMLQPGEERPVISSPFDLSPQARVIQFSDEKDKPGVLNRQLTRANTAIGTIRRATTRTRKPKLILLREEKDRFDAMRKIQADTAKFKKWSALCVSVIAFGILWCIGAVVFWQCEKDIQGMTYFQALYFCYVSLLTIGYGDLAPKSNPGRPFFVVWSLLAVPTMSILVNDLGDTVISKFKQGTADLADFTVLPQKGIWHDLLERNPWLMNWLTRKKQIHDAKMRLEEGFQIGPVEEEELAAPTIDQLATEHLSEQKLALRLAKAIQRQSKVARENPGKRYTYEEWVEFTQLIRFTAKGNTDEEEQIGLIEWDWIGTDSPMMAKSSEPEFVLERLCESMNRHIRNAARAAKSEILKEDKKAAEGEDDGVRQRKPLKGDVREKGDDDGDRCESSDSSLEKAGAGTDEIGP